MKKITSILGLGIIATSAHAVTLADGWVGSADFGLTLTNGNSDTTLISAGLNLAKDTGDTQQLAGLAYTFGETSGDTTNDVLSAFYTWNKLATETSYYGFRFEGLRDDIALIDYRLQATALYGVHLVKNDTTTFSIEAGPGYSFESLDDVDTDGVHLYLGQRATHKFSENTLISQSLAAYAPVEDFDAYNFVFTLAVETKMSDALSLRIAIEDTYTNAPAAGATENDVKLISGISYKF